MSDAIREDGKVLKMEPRHRSPEDRIWIKFGGKMKKVLEAIAAIEEIPMAKLIKMATASYLQANYKEMWEKIDLGDDDKPVVDGA